jgi:ENTS family enterobactin (siderophore) exporter
MGALMTPAASASLGGWVLAVIGLLLVVVLRELRRFSHLDSPSAMG